MNVTREIVKDLLPLYVAGEVSADSRAAVETVLRDDADLRRLADALRADAPAATPAPPPSADRAALEQTRAYLRRRTNVRSLAIMFSLMPLSFSFDSHGMKFVLFHDKPELAVALGVAGIALWFAVYRMYRRGRVTGL